MSKRRVLFVSESHFMYTGFGTYAKEVLKYLTKDPDLEVAEFGSYGRMGDHRLTPDCDWLYYPNEPLDNDPDKDAYHSQPINQFGA